MRLVYHSNAGVESAAFTDAVREILQAAPGEEVLVVSPYLSHDVLEPLVRGRPFRLVTDLPECLERSEDQPLVEFLIENAQRVRHLRLVHAKAVITAGGLLIGSANLTKAGFAERDEMGCLFDERNIIREALLWFDDLWSTAVRVDSVAIREEAERGRVLRHYRSQSGTEVPPSRLLMPRQFRQARRTLGWMRSHFASKLAQSPADGTREFNDLVSVLRSLSRTDAETRKVVDLLGRAIEVAALEVHDERLHLNYGSSLGVAVTILQRYVAWCQRKHGVSEFGFILDDVALAERASRSISGAYNDRFRRRGQDDAPTLHVPVAMLAEVPDDVIRSWERAIRAETQRGVKSSFLKHKRPFLFDALRDPVIRNRLLVTVSASRGASDRP